MKWIKKFEELDPSTYRSAGKKLIDIGHSERGFNLLDHSYNKEHGVSNLWFCTRTGGIQVIKGQEAQPFSFSFEKSNISYCDSNKSLIDITTMDPEAYVDEFGDKDYFGLNINFFFTPTSKTVKGLNLKEESYNLFSITFFIDGSENKDGDVKVTINNDFYNTDEYTNYYGIFSDRRSALHFLKNILPNEISKYEETILNIFSLTEISTTVCNDKVLNVTKKIKLNNLYRNEIAYNVSKFGHAVDKDSLYNFFYKKNDITT